jgi:hypothetical protein
MEFNESDFDFDDLDDDGDQNDFNADNNAFGQNYDEQPVYEDAIDDRYAQAPRLQRARRSGGGFDLNALLSNPTWVIAGIIGAFLIGLVLGWIGLGWYIAPVTWVDANAKDLRQDLQVDFMRMAIDSYNLRPDTATATRRLQEYGDADHAAEVLAGVAANPQEQSPEVINVFQQLVTSLGASASNSGGGLTDDPQAGATSTPGTGASADGPGMLFFVLMCLLVLALGGLVVVFIIRRRSSGGPRTAAAISRQYSDQVEQTDFEALGQSAPIAQWMTTYLIGDDLFDDSFSIDSPSGEFFGECGVGIADTIGVGEPKRVSAFEVWLFDKNDIQTVTKVLMSNHVYSDDSMRERLSAKGEPVLVRPGEQAVLETETLQMVARVVDLAYGTGALPDDSFFDRVTIELAIWQK